MIENGKETTMHYRITSKAGADCGIWSGKTPAWALLSMHRDAGYGSDRVWLEDGEMRFDSKETAESCGDCTDWFISSVATVAIKVDRSDSGTYQICGDAEDWEDICAATASQMKLGDLIGWDWLEVWKVIDGDGYEVIYFVGAVEEE